VYAVYIYIYIYKNKAVTNHMKFNREQWL